LDECYLCLNKRINYHYLHISQVSSLILFIFQGLEQALEVTSTEAPEVSSLDDFNENSGSVFEWLSEELQQVSVVIVVNQQAQLFNQVDIFLNIDSKVGEGFSEVVVVRLGDRKEFNTSFFLKQRQHQ